MGLGEKYKIKGEQRIIEDSYEYYIHANFGIDVHTTIMIRKGGQLSLGDGKLINNGTIKNYGTIIT